ncbi:acyl carrier protein [Paenibacillus sinopodophylli]|uniref:acyl carrier protein n=1 Tax=Paenibacillus sinopodophylli TaxID=1837342 RepID=UPI00110C91D6|nr:acyl carrier protein [Paenibacillus sinopodophylli]
MIAGMEQEEERKGIMNGLREDIAELIEDSGLALQIGENDLLEPAGVDSFVMINLILRVEQRYGVTLSDGDLRSEVVGTLAGLADSICAKRKEDTA